MVGETYCVRYFVRAASAHQLRVDSVFEPNIEICMIRMPLYTTQGQGSTKGTKWGDRYIWIPRMQFKGEAPVKGDQTDADVDTLSGSALPYEEAAAEGICVDEASFALAYMVDMPVGGALVDVKGMAIVGGVVTVAASQSVQVPVKYVMADDSLVQPDYSDLTYTVTDTSKATVSDKGVLTGAAAGNTEITVENGDLSVVANVVVTA